MLTIDDTFVEHLEDVRLNFRCTTGARSNQYSMANAATSNPGGKHTALRARLAKSLKNPKSEDSNIMPQKKTFRECVQV